MTDATKWKSVMLRVDAYERLKQIAARDRRSIASILNELIEKEWEWHFGNRKSEPTEIVKEPQRVNLQPRPKNPFLRTTNS